MLLYIYPLHPLAANHDYLHPLFTPLIIQRKTKDDRRMVEGSSEDDRKNIRRTPGEHRENNGRTSGLHRDYPGVMMDLPATIHEFSDDLLQTIVRLGGGNPDNANYLFSAACPGLEH